MGFLLCALANMSFWSSFRGTKGKPILRMSIYPCEDEIQALLEWKKVKVKMLVTKSCPTLGDPMDCSPLDSSVHGILQARILERVAIPFSRGPSWPRDQTPVFCTAGRFITVWATKEAPWNGKKPIIILPHPQYYFCYLSPWERHAIMKLTVHRFSFKKMETELQKTSENHQTTNTGDPSVGVRKESLGKSILDCQGWFFKVIGGILELKSIVRLQSYPMWICLSILSMLNHYWQHPMGNMVSTQIQWWSSEHKQPMLNYTPCSSSSGRCLLRASASR